MLKKSSYVSRMFTLVAVLVGLTISTAQADDDENGGIPVAMNAKWKEECSGCHIAYPPRFLPAQSWRVLMAGLDKHFGSDASLDVATVHEISDFLEKNSDQRRRQSSGKVILRISETRWFKSEHEEVSLRDWKNPQVKSPANCAACHRQADMGDFSERNVKIPR
jgi:hypothetical protein